MTRPSRTARASTSRSPSTLQVSPRRSVRSPRGANRSSPRRERTAASPSGWSVRCITRSTPSSASSVRDRARDRASRAPRGRGRRPARRASSDRPRSRRCAVLALAHAAGGQHAEAVERAEQIDLVLDLRLRVVRADDDGVLLEERVGPPAASIRRSICWSAAASDVDLRVRPVLVRVRVVVGQRQQQEVEQVVLDEVRADAARVLVAHAGKAELRPAPGPARGEHVGVEELARARDRLRGTRSRRSG